MLLRINGVISSKDLGYLLHKNPANVHTFELSFGTARVFYPEVGDQSAEAALLLDIDPVALVRGSGKPGAEGALDQYVNDRPYAASSFLSVAISRIFGTAMAGRCKERQELADRAIPWEVRLTALPCRGGEEILHNLFEPLGYTLTARRLPLDESFPEWGESPYYGVELRGEVRLRDLLTHLYVMVPVLDVEKHYWVGDDEVEKLLSKGEGWLADHPHRETIATRYLRFDRKLTRQALARLMEHDIEDPERTEAAHREEEEHLETTMRLSEQRIGAVLSALRAEGARSVVDLGCGEGRLLRALLNDRQFERIVGMDVCWRNIEAAHLRLGLERIPPAVRKRIELIHGSLLYRDRRLAGFDAATVVEVIEHLDPPRLAAFERVVFEKAQPRSVVVTTPNVEYNEKFESLPGGSFRHRDHRFEWTRRRFAEWASGVGTRFGYKVRLVPIGMEDAALGSPTQMGVFSR
ncbi:MAG: 3' terminal RNA ribose 2'-O-methyltransferase Hen1 [Bryobacteraceae bacterium]